MDGVFTRQTGWIEEMEEARMGEVEEEEDVVAQGRVASTDGARVPLHQVPFVLFLQACAATCSMLVLVS